MVQASIISYQRFQVPGLLPLRAMPWSFAGDEMSPTSLIWSSVFISHVMLQCRTELRTRKSNKCIIHSLHVYINTYMYMYNRDYTWRREARRRSLLQWSFPARGIPGNTSHNPMNCCSWVPGGCLIAQSSRTGLILHGLSRDILGSVTNIVYRDIIPTL